MAEVKSGQDVADEIEAPFRKAYDKFSSYMGKVPSPSKQDTSYHDEMVKEATASFRKGTPVKSSGSSGKPPKRKTTRKTGRGKY